MIYKWEEETDMRGSLAWLYLNPADEGKPDSFFEELKDGVFSDTVYWLP